ncbi:hypothetical protein JW868_00560 [Candidatus Woesearchaeota archaeon]|nr:hypothetical protein [Candidatus Woesearchaeota archaeon]
MTLRVITDGLNEDQSKSTNFFWVDAGGGRIGCLENIEEVLIDVVSSVGSEEDFVFGCKWLGDKGSCAVYWDHKPESSYVMTTSSYPSSFDRGVARITDVDLDNPEVGAFAGVWYSKNHSCGGRNGTLELRCWVGGEVAVAGVECWDNVSPGVWQVGPVDEYSTNSSGVNFSCNATDNTGLTNVSLWGDWGGGWQVIASETQGNLVYSVNESFVESLPSGVWNWACGAEDTGGNSAITSNRSITVDVPVTRSVLEYDANGNLVSGDGKFRVYNSLNQLWKIYNGSNTSEPLLQQYTYHPTEERVLKKVTYDSEEEVDETVIYWSKDFVSVINSSGTYNYTYVYHNGQLVAQELDGVKHFVHSDHLGSSTVVTDSTGDVVEDTTYAPFGQILSGGEESRYDYEGQEFDSVLGDYGYHFRRYDSTMQIFTQSDTLIQNVYDPQNLNRYVLERVIFIYTSMKTGHAKLYGSTQKLIVLLTVWSSMSVTESRME